MTTDSMHQPGADAAVTEVRTETYAAEFTRLPSGLLYMDRRISYRTRYVQQDVLGHLWALSVGDVPEGIVSVKTPAGLVPVSGRVAVFVPPFQLVEWHLGPGACRFDTWFGRARLPADLPVAPMLMSVAAMERPVDCAGVVGIIRQARPLCRIDRQPAPEAMALEAKRMIDRTYATGQSLGDVAARIGTNPTTMGRVFRQSYGITPVAYRNKLRVMDAMRILLVSGSLVADTAHEVGFGDLTRFNRQFRREFRTTPSSYRQPVPAGTGHQ